MPEDAPALAIDGGRPLLSAYPAAPPVQPAPDAEPARALERTCSDVLGLPAEHVVAIQDQALAYRVLIGAGLAARGEEPGATPEVIVPALLGEPSAAAAWQLGLTVVPGEVESSTVTLSPRGFVHAAGPRTALVVAVHAFGHPAPIDELARAAEVQGIVLLEDASDAVGATLHGIPAGRMAEGAVVAFAPGRLLSGGAPEGPGGGALLVLRDPLEAERARAERTEADADLDEHVARSALAELRELEAALGARRRLAWELTFNLRGVKALVPMPHGRWVRHGYARYVVRLRSLLWKRSIQETIAAIRAEGVECAPAVGPSLHRDPAVRSALADGGRLADDRFRAASQLPQELIALPLHAGLTSRDMVDVANVLRHVERWST